MLHVATYLEAAKYFPKGPGKGKICTINDMIHHTLNVQPLHMLFPGNMALMPQPCQLYLHYLAKEGVDIGMLTDMFALPPVCQYCILGKQTKKPVPKIQQGRRSE